MDKQFDVRVITLFSRNVSSGIPWGSTAKNQYYSFSYYDIIQVDEINFCKDKAVLKQAYRTALEVNLPQQNNGLCQFMLALTDVKSDLEGKEQKYGYTEAEINAFWNASEAEQYAIFFTTMVNIAKPEDLEKVLETIQNTFQKKPYLAYLTFDHSDIIIFFRGNSFQEYANLIFSLAYAGSVSLADTITMCTFNPGAESYSDDQTFGALFRVGVRDYNTADKFFKMMQALGKPVQRNWLLGRNDISFFCPAATLKWLNDVSAIAKKIDENLSPTEDEFHWYTTFDFQILAEHRDIQDVIVLNMFQDVSGLHEQMGEAYRSYETVYRKKMNELHLPIDEVWLRWLKISSDLSVSLLGNGMASYVGICLVPQFLDLFEYAGKFFKSSSLDGQKYGRDEIEEIERSFSTFFSDIAILIDSMNQTNRQFVQVPSFHLPSFEMPPQIMAYYIAMAHRLKDVLHDDALTYGIVILPKFIRDFGVTSLAVPSVSNGNEWLEMVISETSLYTLQLTTETMAHEISHFVGGVNRCREERKEFMLKCALQAILTDMFFVLPDELKSRFTCPANYNLELQYPQIDMQQMDQAAISILKALCKAFPNEYQNQQNNYRRDVYQVALDICGVFYTNPEVFDVFAKCVWDIVFQGSNEKYLSFVMKYEKWQICGSASDFESDSQSPLSGQELFSTDSQFKQCAQYEIDEMLRNIAFKYQQECRKYAASVQCINGLDRRDLFESIELIPYFFSETFADLQAIVLFNMKWADYCKFLLREEEKKLGDDIPLRMLAVTKAMVETGAWQKNSLDSGGSAFEDSAFEDIRSAIDLDPLYNAQDLEGLQFNPNLLYYLVKYLKVCKQKIEETFAQPELTAKVKNLRDMHTLLSSDKTSCLDLQKGIIKFISNYCNEIIGSPL